MMIMREPLCRAPVETSLNVIKHSSSAPVWLLRLLKTGFFTPCSIHTDSNKTECNHYCIDCMGPALCSSCLVHHKDHHIIQIRRSSYHDVVRVSEIQKVLDLNGIQSYIINSARVMFINGRPQLRQGKGVTNNCEICSRGLLDAFRFCSLGCKLTGITRYYPEMTFLLDQSKPAMSDGGASSANKAAINNVRAADIVETRLLSKRPLSADSNNDEYDNKSYAYAVSMDLGMYNLSTLQWHDTVTNCNDMSPRTPPPIHRRIPSRRKGIPYRAHMGV